LYVFHRELADQDAHAYEVLVGVRQTVNYETDADTLVVGSAAGAIPMQMTITDFAGMSYHYYPNNLEPDIVPICQSILKKYPDETVVELASRYLEGLTRTFNTGSRAGKFGDTILADSKPPTAQLISHEYTGQQGR